MAPVSRRAVLRAMAGAGAALATGACWKPAPRSPNHPFLADPDHDLDALLAQIQARWDSLT